MSTRVEYTYPRAPITVEPDNGRKLDFEVESNGSICISAEVEDLSGWSGPRTAETYFTISAEDWAAVIAHVSTDIALLGQDQGGDHDV